MRKCSGGVLNKNISHKNDLWIGKRIFLIPITIPIEVEKTEHLDPCACILIRFM